MELIYELFDSRVFIPHGHCYLWNPSLVWLHILSDLFIAIAYYSIPISLVYFVHKREDLPYQWIFGLFSLFIILCGTTHLIEIWTLWHPTYWISGIIKALTAIVSIFTAASFAPLIPQLLALPSHSQLAAINVALEREIAERKQTELELIRSRELREAIYNESADAIFLVDSISLLIFDCNQRAIEMFEINQKEDLIGIAGHTLQKKQFTDNEISKIVGDMQNFGFWSSEIEYVTRKGRSFWGSIATKPINVAGKAINMVRVKDISDRKEAEERIRRLNIELEEKVKERTLELSKANAELEIEVGERKLAQERFYLVLKNSPITVFMQDRELRYTWFYNPALRTNYEEIIGKNDFDLFLVPEDAQRLTSVKKLVLNSGVGVREEVFVMANGQKRYFDLTVEPYQDRNGEFNGIGCVALDITWRKQSEEELRSAYEREVVLTKEIHHRVKNNLQIVSGLLYLQSRQVQDREMREIINSSRNRIQSMALLHEKLYQSKNLENIDFIAYIKSLTRNLQTSYASKSAAISLNINAEPVNVDIDTAIYCGLIINELVSNSFKYAFPEDRTGQIMIEFAKHSDDFYNLIVRDNGIGMTEAINLKDAEKLGLQLVYSLVTEQLKGEVLLENFHGTVFKISFKIKSN
ncbi:MULTISPECIES: histidine kinase dimerization/phosphoacceptor domain -containing protein [Pseudanabaena]|uniref:histidine kinase n=2 Tax=Pseudanabaena TaxID=1152 RepID=L8N3P6_9CYAN|nr:MULTISPECIES: histidine kinase dimerization/phosphoacceptor domain -containing protein [Pseudanabaena]ELS33330.1 signal transduction histidine kinase [Pseudanabaena biceps PCC 7429]MDG3494472.1 histidine kinase dimerization/phosphoacceptor domain -containing protein [Pseudanabaena catenata USMAC16]